MPTASPPWVCDSRLKYCRAGSEISIMALFYWSRPEGQPNGSPRMPAFDDLASRHCRPLKGPEHRLDADAIKARMAALPDWQLLEDGAAIGRSFKFDDYHRT